MSDEFPHSMPLKSHVELEDLGSRVMQAAGAVRHLVSSNLVRIDSHGVMRLPDYVSWLTEGDAASDNRVKIVRDRGAVCVMDARFTYGPVAASTASQVAVEKAQTLGVGMVSVKNATHTGRLGECVFSDGDRSEIHQGAE